HEAERLVERALTRLRIGEQHLLTHRVEGSEDLLDETAPDALALRLGAHQHVLQVREDSAVAHHAGEAQQHPIPPRGDDVPAAGSASAGTSARTTTTASLTPRSARRSPRAAGRGGRRAGRTPRSDA